MVGGEHTPVPSVSGRAPPPAPLRPADEHKNNTAAARELHRKLSRPPPRWAVALDLGYFAGAGGAGGAGGAASGALGASGAAEGAPGASGGLGASAGPQAS